MCYDGGQPSILWQYNQSFAYKWVASMWGDCVPVCGYKTRGLKKRAVVCTTQQGLYGLFCHLNRDFVAGLLFQPLSENGVTVRNVQ